MSPIHRYDLRNGALLSHRHRGVCPDRGGKLSAEELARSCLIRIAAREPAVRAWSFLDPDHVVRVARELDKTPPAAGSTACPSASRT